MSRGYLWEMEGAGEKILQDWGRRRGCGGKNGAEERRKEGREEDGATFEGGSV